MSTPKAPDAIDLSPQVVFTVAELLVLEAAHGDELHRSTPGGPDPRWPAGDGWRPPSAAPGHSRRSPATSEAARARLEEARLSLRGRGLLTPDGELGGGGPGGLVQLLLDVRFAARAMVVAERVVLREQARPELRTLHLFPDGGVVEDQHPDGLVGMHLARRADHLVDAVTEAILPVDAVPGTGGSRVLDPTRPEVLADRLAGSLVLVDLTLHRPGREEVETWVLAVGADGCYLGPAPDRSGGDSEVTLRPVDPEQVRSIVRGWVETVLGTDT